MTKKRPRQPNTLQMKASSPWWPLFALLCNILGTISFAFAFHVGPSDFRLISLANENMYGQHEIGNKHYIICVGKSAMAASDESGAMGIGGPIGCSDNLDLDRAAVVTSNHPWFGRIGLFLNVLGFAMQAIAAFGRFDGSRRPR